MCIHELSVCDWCPSQATYVDRREVARTLLERPARVLPRQVKATVVPVPSTGTFGPYEAGYESPALHYTKQVPTLTYPHWAVTSETVVQDLPMTRHYERSIYGEVTFVGLVRAW